MRVCGERDEGVWREGMGVWKEDVGVVRVMVEKA